MLLVLRGHILSVSLRSKQLRIVFETQVKKGPLTLKSKKGDLDMEYATKRAAPAENNQWSWRR